MCMMPKFALTQNIPFYHIPSSLTSNVTCTASSCIRLSMQWDHINDWCLTPHVFTGPRTENMLKIIHPKQSQTLAKFVCSHACSYCDTADPYSITAVQHATRRQSCDPSERDTDRRTIVGCHGYDLACRKGMAMVRVVGFGCAAWARRHRNQSPHKHRTPP